MGITPRGATVVDDLDRFWLIFLSRVQASQIA